MSRSPDTWELLLLLLLKVQYIRYWQFGCSSPCGHWSFGCEPPLQLEGVLEARMRRTRRVLYLSRLGMTHVTLGPGFS